MIVFFDRNVNKARIIALYIQYRDGVPEEDRRRLYQHARLSLAEIDALKALGLMGVKISKVWFSLIPNVVFLCLYTLF